jgi:hypothetical protein
VDFRSAANLGTDLKFKDVFGDSVGSVLYRTAREEFVADYRRSFLWTATSWAVNATLVIGLLFAIHAVRQCSCGKKKKAFIEAFLVAGTPMFIVALIDFSYVRSGREV